MDKAITTSVLIVISMVLALVLFNAAYPAITRGSDAITSMAHREIDSMKSQVTIIHAAAELDSNGQWQDTNDDDQFDAFIWIKNVGAMTIDAVDSTDIFFGQEGNFVRIANQADAGGHYPYWTWAVENGTEWTPTATVKITIHYQTPLLPGRYYIKVNTATGASDEYFLGM